MRRSRKQRHELDARNNQALEHLAKVGAKELRRQQEVQAFLGEPSAVLSHIEGAWEVPVRRIEAPGLEFVVAATAPAQGLERVMPGSLFSLDSTRAPQGKLGGFARRGWALVQAWPLAAPGVVEESPGYQRMPGLRPEGYMLCVLRTMSVYAASQQRAAGVDPELLAALPAQSAAPSSFSVKA